MKEGIIIKKSYELYRTDEGQREIIHHIKSDTFLTVTSNEELKKILEAKKIYFVVQNIRGKDRKSPRIYISNGGKNNWDSTPMFSRVAYDCYYNGITAERIQNYYQSNGTKYLENDALSIDHLDANWRNNTKENLFEMTRKDNNDKYEIQRKYKGIFHVVLANDGEFCRIQFAYSTSRGQVYAIRYRCRDGKSINECLDWFLKSKYKWRIREYRGGVPCNSDYEITRYKYFFPFIGQVKSIEPINQYELAEKMVSMPEDDFPLFDGGMPE